MTRRTVAAFLLGILSAAVSGYLYMLYELIIIRLDRIEGFLSQAFKN